jgi:hypothetical protein
MKHGRFFAVAGFVLVAGLWTAPVLAQDRPKPVSHDTAGREQCLMCHTAGAMEPVPDAPASHADRGNESCLWCHATDSPMLTADAKAIPHDIAGREQCMMCHKAGAMEPVPDAPASHEGRDVKYCTLCHKPAG